MRATRVKSNRYDIVVHDRTGRSKNILPFLKRTLVSSLSFLKLKRAAVSLSIVSDPAIKDLNRKYRGINRPTDVLSFSQESFLVDPNHLGDIIISAKTARKQAKAAKKTTREEFAMLTVHGLLHLLGHDHVKPNESKKMFSLQNQLLEKLK